MQQRWYREKKSVDHRFDAIVPLYHAKRTKSSQSPEPLYEAKVTDVKIFKDPSNDREENDGEIKLVPAVLNVRLLPSIEAENNYLDHHFNDENDSDDVVENVYGFLLILIFENWLVKNQEQRVQGNHVVDQAIKVAILDHTFQEDT